MKKHLLLLLLLFSFLIVHPQIQSLDSGLVAYYPMNGKGTDGSNHRKHGPLHSAKAVVDRNGTPRAATQFVQGKGIYKRGLWAPVDINPSTYPVLTIAAWIKTDKTYGHKDLIANGDKEYCRGMVIDKDDGEYHWSANCGKDGILYGPLVTTEWVFMAVLYDQPNQAVRMIVNNQVFASPGKMGKGSEILTIGNFEGVVDEVRIYDRLLSIPELEYLFEGAITVDTDEFPIKERVDYRKKREEAKLAELRDNPVRRTSESKFRVYAQANSSNIQSYLNDGDTITIITLDEDWAKVSYSGDKIGYISNSTLYENTYPADGSGLAFTLKYTLRNLFKFTSLRSWIIVIVCAVLLFFAFRYFYRIEGFFWRFGNHQQGAMGASRSDPDAYKTPFLRRFFTYYRFRWWPLTIGIIGALTLLVAGIWDSSELEWYFSEGFNILPVGFDRPIHWFLYAVTLIILLMTCVMILESFVVGGWKGGSLRVIFMLVFNLLAFLVFFYLFFVFIVIGAIIFGITLFSGAFSRDRYYYYD
ncbi:MAG: hypothetical protein JXA23_04875 [Bacteroidales bacterium]|nr:hypothetical protein [Bacteroidales bacterium]